MDEEELKAHNATILVQMHSAAAAVITAAMRSLDRSETRIKLRDPTSHTVCFDVVKGDPNLIPPYAMANGVQSVTGDKMVVAG